MRIRLAFLLVLATASLASAQEGPARVIDGDTVVVAGVTVRLYGIDAPERGQTGTASGNQWPCGTAATTAMEKLTTGKRIA